MTVRKWFFAATYDRFMRKAEKAGLSEMRHRLLAGAAGDVLEIGGGTGANLSSYGTAVTSLTITEPDAAMFKRLQARAEADAPATTVLRAPAEDLPFEDGTFDTVVSTLVLCGVDDQPRALREIRRVLRPGGRLLFLEHVRSSDPAVAKKQDGMNWLNRAVVCCDCNRPTLETIEAARFGFTDLQHTTLPKAPPFARPAILGTASPLAPAEQAASSGPSATRS
jgi:ubiquinone/menaquinone biosynthesis C-methylase UbiE